MSQSYLSNAERGIGGWDSIRTIAGHVERAGVDPVDLLRLALAHADLSPADLELFRLWDAADPDIRSAILTLLRSQVAARSAAR